MKNIIISIFIIILLVLIPNFSLSTTENTYSNITENNNIDLKNPTVKAIQITSPETGTYKEGQIININVYFDKKITGEIPTLKIKFGEGSEREVFNGTIYNDINVSEYGQYIEYLYNIQTGDNGYFSTVGLEGGKIKDIEGNEAILSSPDLTGAISIKAETKAIDNEVDEELVNTIEIQQENTEKEELAQSDETIASGEIPYTGIGYGLLIVLLIIGIIGFITKTKYNQMKDI